MLKKETNAHIDLEELTKFHKLLDGYIDEINTCFNPLINLYSEIVKNGWEDSNQEKFDVIISEVQHDINKLSGKIESYCIEIAKVIEIINAYLVPFTDSSFKSGESYAEGQKFMQSTIDKINFIKASRKIVSDFSEEVDDFVKCDIFKEYIPSDNYVTLASVTSLEDEKHFIDKFKHEEGLEMAKCINGYNNGKKSIVKDTAENPEFIMLHEYFHQLSHGKKYKNADREIEFAGLRKFTRKKRGEGWKSYYEGINEGLTDYFAVYSLNKMNKSIECVENSAYRLQRELAGKLCSAMGLKKVIDAYFNNKVDLLINDFDIVLGEGQWEYFSELVERCNMNSRISEKERARSFDEARNLLDTYVQLIIMRIDPFAGFRS